MADKKMPEVKKGITLSEGLFEALPYATNLLLQDLMGFPVNPDRLKTAKFTVSNYKGIKILEKENRKVDNADRRFNFKVVELYGNDADKKKIKNIVKNSFDKMKFIE